MKTWEKIEVKKLGRDEEPKKREKEPMKMMIKILVTTGILLVVVPCLNASCFSTPVAMRIGIKPGITACNYDPGDGTATYSGTGLHVGIGMGSDFFRLAGLDFIPQYRTTSYARDEQFRRHVYTYQSFLFPLFLSVRGYMVPAVTPYAGLGIGFNFRLSGVERSEYSGGTATEVSLGSSLQGFIILGGGVEIKLKKWRIIPEVLVNISGSGDEEHPPQTEEKDIDISVGLYYTQ